MDETAKQSLFDEINGNLDGFIVKPQKEGGGNNYTGNAISDVLKNEDIISTSIIMQKLKPPEKDAYILREGKLSKEKCVSEIGIYGIILSDNEQVHINRNGGYLVRTKNANTYEGGVVSGYSAIDSPYLED